MTKDLNTHQIVGSTVHFSSKLAVDVLDKIGEGAFGEVYNARDKTTRQDFALKLLIFKNQAAKIRVKHEISIHNIIRKSGTECNYLNTLKASKSLEQHTFLLFEKLDIDLNKYQKEVCNNKSMELCKIRNIAQQVLCGLNSLHSIGLTHADLTPQNIMIVNRKDEHWKIQVIDFGNTIRSEVLKTKTSTRYQTPQYRAPEVFRGDQRDEKIDIWSFGIILLQLSIGYCPFENSDVSHILGKHKLFENNIWQIDDFRTNNGKCVDENFKNGSDSFSIKADINDQFTDFLKTLLRSAPVERCSAETAKQHEFFDKVINKLE